MNEKDVEYLGRQGHDVFKRPWPSDEKQKQLPLAPSLKLWNHSPTGFSWGYHGSGPAQLALALLLDATGDAELASRMHQAFKREWVASWYTDGAWRILRSNIMDWLKETEAAEFRRAERGN